MIRVLIIEDHASMREALTIAMTPTDMFKVVGEVASAKEALTYCQRLLPDLVMIDVCTEGGASGLVAAEEIRQCFAEMKIIVMTAGNDITFLSRAKAIGADGFIHKRQSLEEFIAVARKVVEGKKCFDVNSNPPVFEGGALTNRETEVLRLLCQHQTNKEIASTLYISENTVKYHKANLLAKTGFSKTVDLAFYMISNGWINPLY